MDQDHCWWGTPKSVADAKEMWEGLHLAPYTSFPSNWGIERDRLERIVEYSGQPFFVRLHYLAMYINDTTAASQLSKVESAGLGLEELSASSTAVIALHSTSAVSESSIVLLLIFGISDSAN